MSIPGLSDWLATPQGRYVVDWELARTESLIGDVFGFNAFQFGLPEIDYLQNSRISLRRRAGPDGRIDLRCDLRDLPLASASVDLAFLPHVLEFHDDPHQILREIERVLIPEGKVVIVGFNPFSLWGIRRRMPRRPPTFPWTGRYLSVPRLKDWLALLGCEMDRGHFGCYVPPLRQEKWLRRWRSIELAGDRWWPIAGGVYVIRAVKRVHGMRLVKPAWRTTPAPRKALSPIAQKERTGHGQ
jgi:SAM-dependent methyltransferase